MAWYNGEYRRRALGSATADDSHHRRDLALLEACARVYKRARRPDPERWPGEMRNGAPAGAVRLGPHNPDELTEVSGKEALAA